jgi:hypothetical protein
LAPEPGVEQASRLDRPVEFVVSSVSIVSIVQSSFRSWSKEELLTRDLSNAPSSSSPHISNEVKDFPKTSAPKFLAEEGFIVVLSSTLYGLLWTSLYYIRMLLIAIAIARLLRIAC